MINQSESAKQGYALLVEQASPGSKLAANSLRAFFVGGTICAVGQIFKNALLAVGMTQDNASLVAACILIVLAVLLTVVGLYSKLGKIAGAGSIVPITGFANAIASPAIEYKKEGLVLGVGAKMFLIAGPVIVYGAMASVLVGIVYYFLR
ncbi:MAG: SpoVA/SpoVAEb family sporulation membrane protein [Defluviitaleaceae bacterium]|nr:SpoVA/SpoVAEb family sporulation membrane protein [Defluviitaleaceae bacterium]MCL2240533.1 SpoVA/SpoVAEb family sporulation membrane protein [Defluviitaleaceae bacterium]